MTHLLLVEDNEVNRDMLSRRLARRGFTVSTAENGLEAIETALTGRPDLVLMDLSLPVLDGWEATRRLKAEAATAGIPVIALTANATTEDRESALRAGCDAFETKPIDMERLLVRINSLIAAGGGT
jgi:CheY-like chemotaxis protein